jgi:hypothetical protein
MLKSMAAMAANKQEYAMRKILPNFAAVAALGLAACQTGNSQQQPATGTPVVARPVVQYTAPAAGTQLGDGNHRVEEATFAPNCLVYASNANTMFFLSGTGVADLQRGAQRLSLVLERTPGGSACPSVHPRTGMPLGKLREPITFVSGTYTIPLLDRTCTGPVGNFNCVPFPQ